MISVLVIYASLAISTPRVVRLFRQSAAIVERDTGIRLKPSFVRRRNIPRAPYGREVKMLRDFEGYFSNDSRRSVLIVPPALVPVTLQESKSGQAIVCSGRAVLSVFSNTRLERFNLHTLTHEIGHMLGATHSDDLSVMLPVSTSGLYFNSGSVEEIRECVGGL